MGKEICQRTPFKKPLVQIPEDENRHLYRLGENNEFIVRDNPLRVRDNGRLDVGDLCEIDVALALFKELGEYGIPVVPFDTVMGFNPETRLASAFMVTDKVEGDKLPQARVEEVEAENFFAAFLDYHMAKYEAGGFFVADLNVHDFMYGRTRKSSGRRIYLVDLDPYYEYFDQLNPHKRNELFSINLQFLNDLLGIFEKNSSADLARHRKRYKEFLERIRDSLHPDDQRVILDILNAPAPSINS